MSDNNKFNDLIYQIYNTVDEPHTWQEVLAAIAQILDSTHIFLAARAGEDQPPFIFVDNGYEQGYFDRYQQHFYSVDIWRLALDRLKPNKVYSSHQVCDDKEFVNSEIYNDFAIPLGVRHGLGSLMINEDRSVLAEIGITRSNELGYYDKEIRQRADGLIPHIRQALSIAQRMNQSNARADNYQQFLNSSSEAILICDDQDRLLDHNSEAERVLYNGGLIRLNTANQLVFIDSKAQKQFDIIKANMGLQIHTSSSESFTLCNKHFAYRLKVQSWLYPQVTALGVTKASALLLILQPIRSSRNLSIQEMVSYFGFTKAEAEVTELLCLGRSIDEITTIRNTSLHTTRQQVKTCIQKTQSRSQPELVGKVLMALI